jgi:hypothetical protein
MGVGRWGVDGNVPGILKQDGVRDEAIKEIFAPPST